MVMRILAPLYFILSVPEVLSGSVRGAGVSLPPMVISLVCMCLLRVLWMSVMVPVLNDPVAVPLCYPFTCICYCTTFLIYIKKAHWLKH